MRAFALLLLGAPAFGGLVTQVNCTIISGGQTTTYSDPLSCPGGSIIANPPLSLSLDLHPGAGGGFPIRTVVSLSATFDDLFQILSVPSGTIQWFGELDHVSFGGDEGVSGSWSIGGPQWPVDPNIAVSMPFTAGQNIALSIHIVLSGQCCLFDGPDDAFWKFVVNSVKVFDANGNPVAAPVYESSSGYTYPVLGGIEAPEPGTWILAALGLGLVTLRLRCGA